jgi:regulator of PEP synthase PpsR (kinase-PPPase family)
MNKRVTHEELKNDIHAITSGHTKFEEKITEMLDKELKGITTMVKEQVQNLCKEMNGEMQVTQQDTEATRHNLKATHQEFKTQLVAVDSRTRHGGDGNAGTNTDKVKPLKFHGSMSWVVFHHQFEVVANHKWTP